MAELPTDAVGVFTSLSRATRSGLSATAATAERAGFGTLWLADVRGDLSWLAECSEATDHLVLATAVLSIWDLDAATASNWAHADRIDSRRVLLGLGVSHRGTASGQAYTGPLQSMHRYLDALDDAALPVPTGMRMLGANAPRMIGLAGQRTAGAVTQLVTPQRTAAQRQWIGDGPMLAAEVKVVWGGSRTRVRTLGRRNLANYLGLPTYQRHLRAQGFVDSDFAGGGSDHLVDALVAGPDLDGIRRRITEHRDAGADHICLHVLTDTEGAPLDDWTELGRALTLGAGEVVR